MLLSVLADENVDARIISSLRLSGLVVWSIAEMEAGIPDNKVLQRAIEQQALLLTEDSDFGEWIYAHKMPTTGVVFLRYRAGEHVVIAEMLRQLIAQEGTALYGKFAVITPRKVRIRQLY